MDGRSVKPADAKQEQSTTSLLKRELQQARKNISQLSFRVVTQQRTLDQRNTMLARAQIAMLHHAARARDLEAHLGLQIQTTLSLQHQLHMEAIGTNQLRDELDMKDAVIADQQNRIKEYINQIEGLIAELNQSPKSPSFFKAASSSKTSQFSWDVKPDASDLRSEISDEEKPEEEYDESEEEQEQSQSDPQGELDENGEQSVAIRPLSLSKLRI